MSLNRATNIYYNRILYLCINWDKLLQYFMKPLWVRWHPSPMFLGKFMWFWGNTETLEYLLRSSCARNLLYRLAPWVKQQTDTWPGRDMEVRWMTEKKTRYLGQIPCPCRNEIKSSTLFTRIMGVTLGSHKSLVPKSMLSTSMGPWLRHCSNLLGRFQDLGEVFGIASQNIRPNTAGIL